MAKRLPRLIGLPFDENSSFLRGAASAPAAIRAALGSPAGNQWTESLVDLGAPGRLTDAGDVSPSAGGDVLAGIEDAVARLLGDGATPIALGGDHAVTYPALRAVHATHGAATILHVDAHPDLYDEFEGSRFSHACPFARIMEEGLASRLVQVGIRAMTGHQREQADRFGVEVMEMREWSSGRRPDVRGPVYISLDLDGIDPAFAPGVSHREPGGLSVRDVTGLIQGLGGPIIGADVVELNPSRDHDGVTAVVAAKLVKELAGRIIETS